MLDAPSHVHLAYRPGVPLVAGTWIGGRPVTARLRHLSATSDRTKAPSRCAGLPQTTTLVSPPKPGGAPEEAKMYSRQNFAAEIEYRSNRAKDSVAAPAAAS